MSQTPETHTLQANSPAMKYPDKGVGRKTDYDEATAELICVLLATGKTIKEVCAKPGFPSHPTLNRWRTKIPAFDRAVVHARKLGMEAWGDEIIELADDDTLDVLPNGKPNNANVQRSRLQIDTRWRLMQSLAAQTFGDRVQHEHSGEITQRVEVSDRERMRRLLSFALEDEATGALLEGIAADVTPEPAASDADPSPPDLVDNTVPLHDQVPQPFDDDL